MSEILWSPSPERVARANVARFADLVAERHGAAVGDYAALHAWSVAHPDLFWDAMWDFAGVVAERKGERILVDGDKMPGARWFPDARLSFAENLLRRRDDAVAIVFRGEDKVHRSLTFAELHDAVARLAGALGAAGVGPGDRVAGYLPNMPETIIGMLASSSLGAIWSSCSPDFGVRGVLDRFGQIEPKVLLSADGYHYNGKTHDSLGKLTEILAELPSVEHAVVVPYASERPDLAAVARGVLLGDFVADHPAGDIPFARLPFDHPLFIMYSSGTTGVPKCIVHGGWSKGSRAKGISPGGCPATKSSRSTALGTPVRSGRSLA